MSKTPKPTPPVQVDDDDDEDEDEDDPVDAMIKKTGCIELHHELQVNIDFLDRVKLDIALLSLTCLFCSY